ncbi:glucagon receptor isoform X13 [Manis pentadactyla]|uniref:glucagon receptor isoform X13 n=1 Tax=Manis pentadactyla TaxID=143292 RepID=UPI00255CDBB3|nr:glucagon receptor isoform X13 [Manis pentadactyla]
MGSGCSEGGFMGPLPHSGSRPEPGPPAPCRHHEGVGPVSGPLAASRANLKVSTAVPLFLHPASPTCWWSHRVPPLSQLQVPAAQVMDFLFEKWQLYGDQCLHNLSLLPPPTELVCNRTFDKYSCWPDTLPNTTASMSCPWYLPWHHKVQRHFVFKRCGPDGQWVRGPRGQPWRNASQCRMDDEELKVQKEAAKMYSGFQVMYTVGYSLSLGALLLALVILLGLSKLHCTRNYIHANLFASFVLKASSVLAIDALLKTRYNQKIGDDLSVSIWLSGGAVAGCRAATVFMQYGVMANYCWLLVEGMYLHSLLGLATAPERSFFTLYLTVGWGAPMLFIIPWAVVKCLFENIQCWTSNGNMGFWWILRFPVFLAILINFCIFIHILHILVAKLRAHQMRYTDYKLRSFQVSAPPVHHWSPPSPLTLGSALTISSLQGLLVAVLYCFLNKEVQSELLRCWHHWRGGKALQKRPVGSHVASAQPTGGPCSERLLLSIGGASNRASQDRSSETRLADSLPGLDESPV